MRQNSLLLVTKKIHGRHIGGRELLCNLNERVLEALFGERFMKFEIDDGCESTLAKAIGALCGRIDGLDGATISRIVQLIPDEKAGQVFIDGSNLGSVAKAL